MSCCLILQSKNSICIGADTATSIYAEKLGNQFFRNSNDGEKLFKIGKDIIYCSGDMSEVPDVIKNMRTIGGYIDVEHISKYLKRKTFRKSPISDFPCMTVIICRVVGGVSYVHTLEAENNFDVVTRTVAQDGIQVWVGGIYVEKCLQTAVNEIEKLHGDVINTYINTYRKMACQEIGGNINVYYLDSNGYEKIIDNYDLNDGYKPISCSNNLVHGVIAQAIIGQMILGNQLIIKNNANGSTVIDKNGITIYDGKGTEDENRVFFADEEGNLTLKGNVYASGGSVGGLHVSKNSISCKLRIDYEKLPVNDKGNHYYDYLYTYISNDGTQHTATIRCIYDEGVSAFHCEIHAQDDGGNLKLSDNQYEGHLSEDCIGSSYILNRFFNLNELDFVFAYGTTTKYYHIRTSRIASDQVPDASTGDEDILGGDTSILWCHEFNTNLDGSGDSFCLYESEIPGTHSFEIPVEDIIKEIVSSMNTEEGTYSDKNSLYIDQNRISMGKAASFDIITGTSQINNLDCSLIPYVNGGYNLGSPYKKWNTIYASSSTIVTSDKNWKYQIDYDMDRYIALFDKLKPCSFLYIDGNSNRRHIGYIAQDVEAAMQELGIDSVEFAGLCKDKLGSTEIYSLRYDEFQGIYDAKIRQLENRIEKLKKIICNK